MRRRLGKFGLLIVALVAVVAVMGAAFASWTDSVAISGEVDTGTLDLEIIDYSGTWIWKMPDHGIFAWHGWVDDLDANTPADAVQLVSWAKMRAAVAGEGCDVVGETYNIFPYDSIKCDVLLHYNGTVPAMVWAQQTFLTGDQKLMDIMGWDYSVPAPRCIFDTATVGDYVDGQFIPDETIDSSFGPGRINLYNGWQMHYCDYLLLEVVMNIPQDNDLQGLSAQWGVDINAIQWNEWDGVP